MFKTGFLTLAGAMALGAGLAAPANALVTNGGFETGDFTGWTESGNVQALTEPIASPCCVASEGNSFVNFNGGNGEANGSIFQDLVTEIGKKYRLVFDFAKGGIGEGTAALKVSAGDLMTTVEDSTGDKPGAYETYSFDFMASGTSTQLLFEDVSSPLEAVKFDAQLDNISVVAVPEPVSTIAVFAIGAIAVSGALKKKQTA